MLNLKERRDILCDLGKQLLVPFDSRMEAIATQAQIKNPWFTPDHIRQSLDAIATQFLSPEKLDAWIAQYTLGERPCRRVGLVLAGNLPCVGFHDVLSVFVGGHQAVLKYSSKDDVLIPALIAMMENIDNRSSEYFRKVDRLTDFDAVIATGSDTAATHFRAYFGKYPHIIRKNRNAVAVLDGQESADMLIGLGHDIFDYFGLGCRSVSKLYLPRGYAMNWLFEAFVEFAHVIDHNKYKNNFDYNHAIYLLGQEPFLTNNVLILKEDASIASRIACVHYTFYDRLDDVIGELKAHKEQIQCVSSHLDLGDIATVPLGMCQRPGLSDYADGIDTMEFLSQL